MDTFGICLLNHVPVRETVSHTSQMVSELLFGDTFVIEDRYGHWFKIQNDFDHYIGWVDAKQICSLPKDEYLKNNTKSESFVLSSHAQIERLSDGAFFTLGMGSRLPFCKENIFSIENISYRCTTPTLSAETTAKMNTEEKSKALVESAKAWLFTPYLWGGKSIFGVDCSGFTQTLFRMYGHALSRDAKDQACSGTLVNFLEEAHEGDLLFFDNENEEITHVGIYLSDHKIIHASGQVRIDSIDHEGIFKQEDRTYSHHLRLIKSIFGS